MTGCGQAFTQSSSLKTHSHTHTGKRPFVCPYEGCGRAFADTGNRTRHWHTHTGTRPFVCTWEGCGRAFTEPGNRARHWHVHSREKPFVPARKDHTNRFSPFDRMKRPPDTRPKNSPAAPGWTAMKNDSGTRKGLTGGIGSHNRESEHCHRREDRTPEIRHREMAQKPLSGLNAKSLQTGHHPESNGSFLPSQSLHMHRHTHTRKRSCVRPCKNPCEQSFTRKAPGKTHPCRPIGPRPCLCLDDIHGNRLARHKRLRPHSQLHTGASQTLPQHTGCRSARHLPWSAHQRRSAPGRPLPTFRDTSPASLARIARDARVRTHDRLDSTCARETSCANLQDHYCSVIFAVSGGVVYKPQPPGTHKPGRSNLSPGTLRGYRL